MPQLAYALLAASVPLSLLTFPATAWAEQDVTAAVLAGRKVTLRGDAVVRLPGGTITYGGVFKGRGTLTIAGSGRLILTGDSDFTLPKEQSRQKWNVTGGNHPLTQVENPDPPAITIARGATLQYGTGTGPSGVIGHFTARPGFQLNTLNIRVDGTLDVAVHRALHLGIMSGTGLIATRRNTWPGLQFAGAHTFKGVIYNGTGTNYASPDFTSALPGVRTLINQGSWIMDAPIKRRTVLGADIYSREYGNDINFHSRPGGEVVMTGVYSWADGGAFSTPTLSDPALNYKAVPRNPNKRGINIEGARVQWGNGKNNRFFLPGNKDTVYINMHAAGPVRSSLTLDYNGPVSLGAPISGGRYHDTLAAPGKGDVVIAGTPGNAVTFAAAQNYDGKTTIGRRASLTLGSRQGDSGLRGGGPIVDDGTLILANAKTPIQLTSITGKGSLKQAGQAVTTLNGTIAYTGATTISAGTLALRKGTLSRSSSVTLSQGGTLLDLADAADQTINNLTGAPVSEVLLGVRTLTVVTTKPGTFGGILTGAQAGFVKKGPATLTLTGPHQGERWRIDQGELRLNGSTTAGVTVAAQAALSGTGGIESSLTSGGELTAGLKVKGAFTQLPTGTLETAATPLTADGQVVLDGRLTVGSERPPRLPVIDNRSKAKTAGTFTGLEEGARVPGTPYRITYQGGDGNDVVLADTTKAAFEVSDTSVPATSSSATQPRDHGMIATFATAVGLTNTVIATIFWRSRRRRSAFRNR